MGKAYCFYQNYREVSLLVIHCSATRYDRDFPMEALRSSHKARGFADIGYHFYITRDGKLHRCRPVNQIGAHAAGWNDKSIGICYEGGLDEQGRPADTRTYAQRCTLMDLLRQLRRDYPERRLALALTQGRSMKPYESHTMPPQKIVVIHLLDINYSLLIHRRLELKHYVSNYFYLNK